MKNIFKTFLVALCMMIMPNAVSAANTDKLEVTDDRSYEITEDVTYGALHIINGGVKIQEGVTVTIDGSMNLTNTNNKDDVKSSLVYMENGFITMAANSTLNIVNASGDIYAAFKAIDSNQELLGGATLNVSNNDTRGIEFTSTLLTLGDSKLIAKNNTLDAVTVSSLGAARSTIEITDNKANGLKGNLLLNQGTVLNVSNNGLSGIIFTSNANINGDALVEAYNNNTLNNPDAADVVISKTLNINQQAGLSATTVMPYKDESMVVSKDSKIVINGNQAVALIGLYNLVCDGAVTDDSCSEENLISTGVELTNGIHITMNENQALEATVGGEVDDGLELPSEVEKVVVLNTLSKDLNITVANNTVIENNSSHKVNAKVGETTVVVDAGKSQTISVQTTETGTTNTNTEELPPKTGDINLLIILATIIAGLGLTGFVGKKIYARLN